MTLLKIDHVQLAMPKGQEDKARAFYGELLALPEVAKPVDLAKRGGVWFQKGCLKVHLGVEHDFKPARKAHPAFEAGDLTILQKKLNEAGHETTSDDLLEGFDRFFVNDPFGNRLEFLQPYK